MTDGESVSVLGDPTLVRDCQHIKNIYEGQIKENIGKYNQEIV